MKIKYRRFDDIDYTEVDVVYFSFYNDLFSMKEDTKLIFDNKEDGKTNRVMHVCEV